MLTQYNNSNTEIVNFMVRKVGWGMCGTGEEQEDSRLLLAVKGLFHKNGLGG